MRRRVFLAGATALAASPAAAGADLAFSYRGFSVDATQMAGSGQARDVRRALERQIDMITGANVPADMLAFFRSEKVFVLKDAPFKGPGHFNASRGIELKPGPDPDKPILLHEMLHAYHSKRLPKGRDNPTVLGAYQDARRGKFWPADSYLMTNDNEFFAVTGSCYLYGKVEREPFNRANIKKAMPRYYQWMADLFDGGRPR